MDEKKSNGKIINNQVNFIKKGIIPAVYINSEKIRLLIYRKIK